ncbi:hypothetical protein GCM10007901_21590 [Dyella acidisoli]|uniref:Uncharacterized protein n=1 Tax=Dyella acidisoli TaxID=1867834 RepID=A0ABQ5XRS9_9GAMM|nr:hypothetical protein GCM10007901_21590 [Dyella acidisoli]
MPYYKIGNARDDDCYISEPILTNERSDPASYVIVTWSGTRKPIQDNENKRKGGCRFFGACRQEKAYCDRKSTARGSSDARVGYPTQQHE